jgi:hypothetical protein
LGVVQENEKLQLAPPMAADTLRAAADGDASVHSGAALVDDQPLYRKLARFQDLRF